MRREILIAISAGDPCGIGPEVTAKAVLQIALANSRARFVIFGERNAVEQSFRRFAPQLEIVSVSTQTEPAAVEILSAAGSTQVVFCPIDTPRPPSPGSADAGDASFLAVKHAAEFTLNGGADALVTAPINKSAWHAAGHTWPGHTEFLGHLTGGMPLMMLVGGGLRVALVTTHVAVKDIARSITRQKILQAILILNLGLRTYFGFDAPRIAVCGLNPHASDNGAFGTEEAEIIAPAVADLNARGVNAVGPLPADSVFWKARQGEFDAVLAMYHDQALIPIKLLAFDSGVNVTLGLPIIRTSPDHGTAYDIAGKGIANPASMRAAIELAIHMAEKSHVPSRTPTADI